MDVQDALRNAPLFAHLSKKDLKQLAGTMSERAFPAGSVVVEEGKPGLGFFVIAAGTASVTVGGKQVRRLGSGDFFGEVALIDEGPRMAAVAADTDLQCFVLASWQFRPFVQDHPDVAWGLLRALVQRIVREGSAADTG